VPGGSFDGTPGHAEAAHQGVNAISSLMLSLFGEMGITNGGQNGLMPKYFLDVKHINTGFNQVRGIAVA